MGAKTARFPHSYEFTLIIDPLVTLIITPNCDVNDTCIFLAFTATERPA